MFNWGIKTITFSSGDVVRLEPSSVLVIVGPNSGGKTSSIRGIEGQLHTSSNPKSTISKVETFLNGNEMDFTDWLSRSHYLRSTTSGDMYITLQGNLRADNIQSAWGQLRVDAGFGGMYNFLWKSLDTETRLHLGNATASLEHGQIELHAFIHVLQRDDKLREQISKEIRDNFGFDLIINWGGANQVWFNVGDEPVRTLENDRVSHSYLEQLNQLPRLEREGDGIRSFVGTLLATLCVPYKVIAIDEPEVFLHPPQARRLANILARSALDFQRQVIIATHSSEVIRGVIDTNPHVILCRVTRNNDVNNAAILQAGDIREIFSKPLLNSVSAIDGVFYDGVIICEADTDNRFYEAVTSYTIRKEAFNKPPYFYFTHGGGKGALSLLATTYRKLHVPTAIIADFDIFRQKNQLESVINALGGDFASIESLYNIVTAALNNLPPTRNTSEFINIIKTIVQDIESQGVITADNRRQLAQLLDDSKAWSEAKKYGITKLVGGTHKACKDLLDYCASLGLFIVPSGELESWWRPGPARKSEWATAAVEQFAQEPLVFRDAIDFTVKVVRYLVD